LALDEVLVFDVRADHHRVNLIVLTEIEHLRDAFRLPDLIARAAQVRNHARRTLVRQIDHVDHKVFYSTPCATRLDGNRRRHVTRVTACLPRPPDEEPEDYGEDDDHDQEHRGLD